MNEILTQLQAGEKFPFSLLACHHAEIDAYWKWWWANKADENILSRPYTIIDDDEVLQTTIDKTTVDTESNGELFWDFLHVPLERGWLPRGLSITRTAYRMAVVEYMLMRGQLLDRKVITFVGGGYGAGKTTTLDMLARCGKLAFPQSALLGVDYCKLLLPEFERVKMVADGRASTICQAESRLISDRLFERALEQQKSFAWDSSMSNREETFKKIHAAREAEYELELVAVWTPPEIAIRRAMNRAAVIRRFANPDFLLTSTKGFASLFPEYFDVFDTVSLFFNGNVEQPQLIGEKDSVDSELASYDDLLVQQFVQFGQQP